MGTVVFPQTGDPGIINFTDLDPASGASAGVINAAAELAQAEAEERKTRARYKIHDGAVAIIVLDAADPDAALEELARYAAADAEDDLP